MSYFSPKETSCKCGCGFDIAPQMLDKLNAIRKEFGRPILISSGARCPAHNSKVGGAPSSYHMKGQAVDMVRTPELEKFMIAALPRFNLRMESLDTTPTWIHIDLGYKGKGPRVFKVRQRIS